MDTAPQLTIRVEEGARRITLGGCWRISSPRPAAAEEALRLPGQGGVRSIILDAPRLGEWDSSLPAFLLRLTRAAREHDVEIRDELPPGLGGMLRLALAVPPRPGSERAEAREGMLERLGGTILALPGSVADFLEFLGEVAIALGRLIRGRSGMRARDLLTEMHACGAAALPIISVTNLLFGLILAFVGSVQLQQFGAQIYVAGLVGVGMLRVMGAIMVGVVMSGRMAASYAAIIGAMQVNEEVDALTVTGMSPADFLVLPRVLALAVMTPLLTIYADLMGMLGGLVVGVAVLDIGMMEYVGATTRMVDIGHGFIGLAYAAVFGVIIALAGCYQGIRCGRSALAVGQATTAAVVQSLVGIIVATAVITVLCNILRV